MTYVIILDGFVNEGWKNIYTLFKPSFYADDIRVYYAEDKYTSSEIEELMPRDEKHNFIYLSMQRGEHPGEKEEKISYYRYKRTLEKIKEQFPYYMEHNNILLMLDYSQKVLGRDEYREIEKKISYELDKKGYVDDNSHASYLFSYKEIMSLDGEYNKYVQGINGEKVVNTERRDVFEKIENRVKTLFEEKKSLSEGNASKISPVSFLAELEAKLQMKISRIQDKDLEKKYSKPSSICIDFLEEYYGIKDDLKNFTLLQYAYHKDIDIELFFKVLSLISLLRNAQKTIFRPYWLEIENLEINLPTLKAKLEKLESLSIEEEKEEQYSIELNNLDTISLPSDSVPIDFPDKIQTPWFYSKREEEILSSEIQQHYRGVGNTLERVRKNIAKIKKTIHDYRVDKIDKTFTKGELQKSIENKNILPQVGHTESIQKIIHSHEQFPLEDFSVSALHEIRKLPSVFRLLLMLLVVLLVMIVPYVLLLGSINLEEWYKHYFPLAVLFVFFLTSAIYIYKLKNVLFSLIEKYEKMTDRILKRIKIWQKNTIEKYEILFLKKMEYENFQILEKKYNEEKEKENQKLYHRNKVAFLKKQVQEVKSFFRLDTNPVENVFTLEDPSKSSSEIMQYALFDEKTAVSELVVDVAMVDKYVMSYGIIERVVIKKIMDKDTINVS